MSTPRRTRIESGIYERADGRLEIGFRDAQGRQRWRVVNGGIIAARKALTAARAQRDRGVVTDPRLGFSAAADSWFDAHVLPNCRPNTIDSYRGHLGHLRQQFGRWRLTNIGPDDIAKYLHAERARGVAGWTLRGRLNVLSGVYAHAIRRLDYPGASPVTALGRYERPSTRDERPKRVLTDDELVALLDGADPWDRLLLEVTARTGLRRGEVRGLVWSEVDFAGSLSITRQLNYAGHRVALKTDRSTRTVDLSAQLADKLREHRLASPRSADHDFVFVRRTGEPYTPGAATRAIDKAARTAGLEGVEHAGEWVVAPLTFHSLRHTHVSRLIAAGWDVQEIASRIGDTVGTVMASYAHEFDAVARAQSRRDRLGAMEAPMEAAKRNTTRRKATDVGAEVVDMQAVRHRAQ